MEKIPHNPEEILASVDENDKIIGEIKRKEVHTKGILHREAYCYLINSKKQLLLQKRADSHIWDHSSAGHFPKDQTYHEAVIREFEEELGIKLSPKNFIEIGKEKLSSQKIINNRFAVIFLVKKDIPLSDFNIDKDEVEELKYFNLKELKELLNSDKITSSAKFIIEKYILKELS